MMNALTVKSATAPSIPARAVGFDLIAAIGDVADARTWSGIPWHFWQAVLRRGWKTGAVSVPVAQAAWPRRWWNAGQVLRGRGVGGYQYSDEFAEWAWRFFPAGVRAPHVLSFHPFTPSLPRLRATGGRLSLYFDATHPLMFARYGLGRDVPRAMQRRLLEKEREIYHGAERLVFFQQWAAESAVRDCGAAPGKVSVILPGANLELTESFRFVSHGKLAGRDRPFRFGYVGMDWRRKGFPKLLRMVEQLDKMGLPVELHCIGCIPDEALRHPCVRHHGVLDKRMALPAIVEIMAACDLGCLLSDAEASSIAVLEFLRVGVPVAATVVDGMGDLIPPDAGFRLRPEDSPGEIAEQLAVALRDPDRMAALRHRARQWSPLVSWDRCVAEWDELLATGKVRAPVRPWQGLAGAKGYS